jgi:hypothetical protein
MVLNCKNEVLKTPEFQKMAADNVVLVELDFPRNNQQTPSDAKSKQSGFKLLSSRVPHDTSI